MTIVTGYYGFLLDIRVCPSIRISFPDDNLIKYQGFLTKRYWYLRDLVCDC